jgi:ribosome-associated toxin RatA of RatAB toxin-antitoxin module
VPTLRKSAIGPHACETMFDLVDRVESYPEFLPWCSGVRLIERTGEVTSARIEISWRGLQTHVATRNAKVRPERMDLGFLEGPFESFAGAWTFVPLGDGGCRVEFSLDYAFAGRALELAMGPLFGHIMGEVVDRFVARAEQVGAP